MEKSRIQHSTGSPYPQTQWPALSSDTEQAVLALLLPLINPIGNHRKRVAQPSRGRHRAIRKPQEPQLDVEDHDQHEVPEVSKYVTIGLTSTYRRLVAQAQRHADPSAADDDISLSAIVVCRQLLPDPACDSLPLLVASACSAARSAEPLRVMTITQQAAMSIAAALDLPRASMIGIGESAPGSKPLMQYIWETVAPIDIPGPRNGPPPPRYLPLKVSTALIPVGKKQGPAVKQAEPVK